MHLKIYICGLNLKMVFKGYTSHVDMTHFTLSVEMFNNGNLQKSAELSKEEISVYKFTI